MKKILLCCTLLLSAIAGAQVVNIPDANFKGALLGTNSSPNSNAEAKDENGNWIIIDANEDGEIQESEALAIWWLRAGHCGIVSAEGLQSFTNLRTLFIYENTQMTFLPVNELINLELLDAAESDALTEFNCTGLQNLRGLSLFYCHGLQTVTLEDLPALENFRIDADYITTFELDDFPALEKFEANIGNEENIRFSIDLSASMNLTHILLNSDYIEYLNLRNGNPEYENAIFNLDPPSEPTYICIDEGEESYLEGVIADGAIVNTYCNFMPGGDYNTITGVFTFDADNNGCDGDDPLNTLIKVGIDDGTETGTTFSNLNGEYNFFTQAGTFTITPEFENNWFTATPASAIVNSATVDNSTTTENFCITANGVHPDIEVVIVPAVPAQPGFDADYLVVYRNKGNQVMSGNVSFTYDGAVLDYVAAYPAEDNAAGNTLTWSYTNLMPFESRVLDITLNVNSPQETPAVNIDDVLAFSASVTPTAGDETPADNVVVYNETVVGSYDPNDKTCLEGSTVTPEMIGGYLHYNINFENTGTAPATFIVVRDVINPAQFDISTLQVLNASHEMMVRVESNRVEFRFDAINLGPLEKGNVLFKIKTLNTLQIGDEVSNFADIFFDYNFPITTNDATTSFEVLGTGDFEIDGSVMIYPNPANGLVSITADSNLTSLQLFDLQGRLLQTVLPNDTKAALDMTSRATGVYLLKVTTDKGSKVDKLVKK